MRRLAILVVLLAGCGGGTLTDQERRIIGLEEEMKRLESKMDKLHAAYLAESQRLADHVGQVLMESVLQHPDVQAARQRTLEAAERLEKGRAETATLLDRLNRVMPDDAGQD